ncbi:hypothetical protein RKD18_002824 [Streptomyces phaeoluteigriseus]
MPRPDHPHEISYEVPRAVGVQPHHVHVPAAAEEGDVGDRLGEFQGDEVREPTNRSTVPFGKPLPLPEPFALDLKTVDFLRPDARYHGRYGRRAGRTAA